MKEFIGSVFRFFRDDFFPNIGFYLLQIFLIVLMVLIFAGINIVVRFITDPICHKVLRMKENKRGPGMVGLVISVIIFVLLLAWVYVAFPQLEPTVVGWTGKQMYRLVNWGDKLPDLAVPPEKAVPKPEKIKPQPAQPAPAPTPAPLVAPTPVPAGAP